MISLCVETATARAGIALTRHGTLLAELLLDAPGGRQNGLLLPALHQLLEQQHLTIQQIDLFSCAVGPGSFTGLRSGIAAVQGLALATGKPCVGVSTLAMLAMNLPHASCPVCPMLDARKNEVYTALYQTTERPEAAMPDQVVAPDTFLAALNGPTIFVGDGALRYQDLIRQTLGSKALFAPLVQHVVRPSAGCLLAAYSLKNGTAVTPEQLLPTYLRPSEAELSRQNKI